jgi:hypothetical protein
MFLRFLSPMNYPFLYDSITARLGHSRPSHLLSFFGVFYHHLDISLKFCVLFRLISARYATSSSIVLNDKDSGRACRGRGNRIVMTSLSAVLPAFRIRHRNSLPLFMDLKLRFLERTAVDQRCIVEKSLTSGSSESLAGKSLLSEHNGSSKLQLTIKDSKCLGDVFPQPVMLLQLELG